MKGPGDDRVPVVDLAVLRRPLRDCDREARARALERLATACRTCGTFYLENHGVPEDVLRHAATQFDAFFDLPLEERMEIVARPGEGSGYEPLDMGRELNDSFSCALGADEFPHLTELPKQAPNRWPRRPAGFEEMVRQTMSALHRLGADVMSALALSLELPADHFDPIVGPRQAGSIRARRYPPQAAYEGRVGTNAHVDGLPLAFIVQNDVIGLETEIPGSGWTAIEPRPGTIVCQLGSLFARWTNDRYVPNRHRVINADPSRERRSIIYWFPIHPETVITCLPTCCSPDDPPRYAPISFTRYLGDWVQSFARDAQNA